MAFMAIPTKPPTHLFDTTVFIDHFRGKSKQVETLLKNAASGNVAGSISVITSAELWRGVCTRTDEHAHRLIISPFVRLSIDHELAIRGGELACLCKKHGFTVSIPDGLIAATAERHNLIIVTGNPSHFENIKMFANLRIESY